MSSKDLSDDDFVITRPKKSKPPNQEPLQVSHQNETFICSHCSMVFSKLKNVKRHERICKANPNGHVDQFICPRCQKIFTRTDNLSAHVKICFSKHQTSSGTSPQENCSEAACKFCKKKFAHKKDAKRHEKGCSKNPDSGSQCFECSKCQKSFKRQDKLVSHFKTCSPRNEVSSSNVHPEFMCSFCSQNFTFSSNLKRHVNECSSNPHQIRKEYQCPSCSSVFHRADHLESHKKICGKGKKKVISCLFSKDCEFTSSTKIALIEHLTKKHGSMIKPPKKLLFKTVADFEAWKDGEEERTLSYYSHSTGAKGLRSYYYCQHDGSDLAHRRKGSEGRIGSRKKRIGQIKRGMTCLSKITVLRQDDGSLTVTYYPSHSHPLSVHDLAHQPASKATNLFINNQLALCVPPTEIYKRLQSTSSERENRDEPQRISRDMVISERRIRQRVAKRRNNLRLHKDDALSVHLQVQLLQNEKYNPVVIYKPMGHPVIIGTCEELDDISIQQLFMLGIQTKEQRELMVKYSNQILIVDDTHNVTQYENVKLFIMVVRDENNRGWPVGFFISNCMSADVLKLFIHAVKTRCEEAHEDLNINVVISDDDSALINGIEAGMGKSLAHILCQWHLDETMKKQIRLKVPRDLFDTVYNEVKVIIQERDETVFWKLYEAFKVKCAQETPEFAQYFSTWYSNRVQKWAMCFRKSLNHSNVDTTGHAESINNLLKTKYFKRIPNKRMDDLFHILLDMERRGYEDRQRFDILGFSESPIVIQEKHARGMTIPDENIIEVNTSLWTIKPSNSGDPYHISRLQEFCSKDHCYDKCASASCHGLCIHLFHCSCKDKPLCKHIHKLQSLILRNVAVSAFDDDNCNVNFFDIEEDTQDKELNDQQAVPARDFSETNMYSRLQANVATLSDFIFKKTIPRHLLPSCDVAVSDLVKKCTSLSVNPTELPMSMPSARSIAPREKLATQVSQLLPFKRKMKKKKHDDDDDPLSRKQKLDKARKRLLGSDIVLVIGPFNITSCALKTIPLHCNAEELEECKAFDENFKIGWLNSEVLNAFIYSLSLTNESIYAGCSDLALSMARGNTLKRLFDAEMPSVKRFLFPANFSGNHWVAIAVLCEQSQIIYFDSMKGKPLPSAWRCIETLKNILKIVKPSISTWTVCFQNFCSQMDSVSCGPLCAWFAHQVILEVEEFSDLTDVEAYRQFIERLIKGNCLKEPDVDKDICKVCKAEDPSASSVTLRCDKCHQLYHQACVGLDEDQVINDDFVCPEL